MHICKGKAISIDKKTHIGKLRPVPKVKEKKKKKTIEGIQKRL